MAAADVEVVAVGLARVSDRDGSVFFGDTKNRTISENLQYHQELRVMVDASVPETAGYPTIKDYLKAMASRGSPHVPVSVTNSMIVTRKAAT